MAVKATYLTDRLTERGRLHRDEAAAGPGHPIEGHPWMTAPRAMYRSGCLSRLEILFGSEPCLRRNSKALPKLPRCRAIG